MKADTKFKLVDGLSSHTIKWFPDGFDHADSEKFKRPFHTFIIKIASLCNLNCSYCYVYQSPDDSWKWKPKLLEPSVAKQIAFRIQEHVTEHDLVDVSIIFHGGEPLLAGLPRLKELVNVFSSVIKSQIHWGIQTNGTLLDDALVDFLYKYRFGMGISLDGSREHNDRHRLSHAGKSSYDKTVNGIQLLQSHSEWKKILSGILVVVDLRNNPVDILKALDALGLRGAKLLLPDAHYESPPPVWDTTEVPYGRWLSAFFDAWCQDFSHIELPYFEQIITLMIGGVSTAEEIGAQSVDLIVIETNGDIEAVDTLKMVGREATATGMNVFSHSLTQALTHPAVMARMSGFNALCQTCRDCQFLQNCGGGYIPHRFSFESGFLNPSIYCNDLKYLFSHIKQALIPVSGLDL